MKKTAHFTFSIVFLILMLCLSLANAGTVFADEGTPTDVPVVETAETPTEPPVAATEVPVEATPAPEEAGATPAEESVQDILAQLPENTDLVVVDQQGEVIPLAAADALEIVQAEDPLWCPVGAALNNASCRSFTGPNAISDMLTAMRNSTNDYNEDGIIYFTSTVNQSLTLTDAGGSLGGDFNTLRLYDLTLIGGWNGDRNAPVIDPNDPTNFGTNTITIGAPGLWNDWSGNVSLQNFVFDGASSNAVTIFTSNGNITLDNVDVVNQTNNSFAAVLDSNNGDITIQNSTFDGNTANQSQGVSVNTDGNNASITVSDTTFQESTGNGNTNYNGATLNADVITLNNVTASGNDGNGISAGSYDLITLNNVNASGNGTEVGSAGNNDGNNVGSGVAGNGNNNSDMIIIGGTFNNNQRYGIEVDNDTTITIQATPASCTGNDGGPGAPGACYNRRVVPSVSVTNSPVVYNGSQQTANVVGSVPGTVSDVRYNNSTTRPTNAGTYTITADLAPNDTAQYYSLNNANAGNFVISKATPVITFGTAPSPIAGQNFSVSATTTNTQSSTLTYTRVSGPCAHTGPATSPTFSTNGVGTCVVRASGAATSNFNAASQTQDITVRPPNTPPTLTLPASPMTVEATSSAGAVVTFSVTATDAEDNPDPTPVCNPAAGSQFALGSTTVNCTVTDSGGMTTNGSFTVVIQDTTAPAVTVPANITAEATGPSGAIVNFTVSASDLVDGPRPVNCTPASGSTFALGTVTVNCSATDTHNNTGNASFTVTVQDTTAPVVTVPANITQEAVSAAGNVVNFTATASDIVDGPRPVICTPASGSAFALGTTLVTCSATDTHSNTGSATFNVTIQDTTAPTVTVPANITREATSPSGAAVTFTASASDIVDGALTPACSPASGSTFALGTTSVTCSITDKAGNTGSASFTITVQDTTAPTVTVPSDITREATGPGGAVATFTTSASDLVDGAISPVCTPASGSTFALGITLVTCTATDAHSNTGSASFHVTVDDTTAPTVMVPANITAEATGPAGATVSFVTSATDVVDGSLLVACVPASGATFTLGTTTVNCTSTDAHGNTGSSSFNVTVEDTTAPTVNVPANIVEEATGPAGAVVSFITNASDIVDGSLPVTCTPASGATFALGVTTVNCTATDAQGNTGHASFIITVGDTTAPVLTLPADILEEAVSPAGNIVTFTASASDLVDGSLLVTCTPPSGSAFTLGVTTVTCSATDSAENTSTDSFTVTVQDTTAPIIADHGDLAIETSSNHGTHVNYLVPTTSDVVDGNGFASCSPASGSMFPMGNTTVTCTATDAHGNAATPSTFTVHVSLKRTSSDTAPDLTIPVTGGSNFTVACTEPKAFLVQTLGANIIFNHLCGYDASVEGLESTSLPGKLPNAESFVSGFTINITKDGKLVKPLPQDASILIQFELPQSGEFAVRQWNGSQWVEVHGEALNGFLTVSTDQGGTFIFIKK